MSAVLSTYTLPTPVCYTKFAPPMREGFSLKPLSRKHFKFFNIESSLTEIQLGKGFVICKDSTPVGMAEIWDWDNDAIMNCFITDQFRKFPVFLTACLRHILENLHSIGYKRIITFGETHSPKWLYKSGFTKCDSRKLKLKFNNSAEVYIKCHS